MLKLRKGNILLDKKKAFNYYSASLYWDIYISFCRYIYIYIFWNCKEKHHTLNLDALTLKKMAEFIFVLPQNYFNFIVLSHPNKMRNKRSHHFPSQFDECQQKKTTSILYFKGYKIHVQLRLCSISVAQSIINDHSPSPIQLHLSKQTSFFPRS